MNEEWDVMMHWAPLQDFLQASAEHLCVEVEAASAEALEGPDSSRAGYHSSGGCGGSGP